MVGRPGGHDGPWRPNSPSCRTQQPGPSQAQRLMAPQAPRQCTEFGSERSRAVAVAQEPAPPCHADLRRSLGRPAAESAHAAYATRPNTSDISSASAFVDGSCVSDAVGPPRFFSFYQGSSLFDPRPGQDMGAGLSISELRAVKPNVTFPRISARLNAMRNLGSNRKPPNEIAARDAESSRRLHFRRPADLAGVAEELAVTWSDLVLEASES